jgi:hypothetical protein
MADEPLPDNAGRRTDGKFAAGNPGKRKGTRNRTTLAMERLLDGDARSLTRKAIDMAKAGDSTAMRLVMERLLPPRKDRPIKFALPPITGAQDHPAALAAVADATARGELTPAEGQAFAAILEQHRRAIETVEIVARLDALEGGLPR